MIAVAVAVAAGLGALARYALDQLVQHRTDHRFPLGTLLVNVSGSLLLGLTVGLSTHHHHLPAHALTVIGTGFAGGYTTLSTWAWETFALAETGAPARAWLNVLGSIAAGLAAAAAGLALALA